MSQSLAIETSHLRKQYNGKVAVADLSLSVPPGEVFGFLGPNGAGKTTSIKMLLGLAAPTSGEGRLLGQPIGHPASRAHAGFLPEHFRFHDWLTGTEFLHLHGQLYGMRDADRQQRVPELLKRVGLEEHADKRLRSYSKGMLQRVGLAQALLNRPAVVFLDEPTSGLDPIGRVLVRDIIHELRAEGTTVFLNSHLLSEVEITCDRVVFIKLGSVVKSVALKELGQGAVTVEIRTGPLPGDPDRRSALLTDLARWGRDVRVEDRRVHLTVENEQALPELARWLVGQGVDLYALTPQHVSLEEMFLQIVGTDGGL
jgi:ABC-2 type transport system ATP-binding protein